MGGVTQQVATWGSSQFPEEIAGKEGSEYRHVGCDGSRQPLLQLVCAIETEIIPRLMLAHGSPGKSAAATVSEVDSRRPGPKVVAEFATLLLGHDGAASPLYVETLRAAGVSLESIYLHVMAPAARRLGELWEKDLCSFTDVTAGLCRLHQLLHQLSPEFQSGAEHPEEAHRVLLAPVPGEQHTFGLWMVEEFLTRAGWDVSCEPGSTSADLAGLVGSERYDLVGLSLACETRLTELSCAIRAIRRASQNRAIGVMVGGPLFISHPELAEKVGADATAAHGGQAAQRAESLLEQSSRRRGSRRRGARGS